MEDLSLHDVMTILKRRRNYFFITASLILLFTTFFVLSWSKYRSTATVQIEQSYVSSSIVTPTGANINDTLLALADQRISRIEQKVTSMDSLAEIITKYELYGRTKSGKPITQPLTDMMRKKIKLELVSGIISNPAVANKETAEQLSAIAFSLSFDYKDPEIAQLVVGELVNRFMEEDLGQRRLQAKETSDFLATQLTQLETSMMEQEKTIAEFRKSHGESGPASLMFNEQANVSATLSLQNVESQLAANEGTQGNIQAQLATVEPYSRVLADGQVLTTPSVQLRSLESEYAALTAHYGPDHPDIIKLRHEIAALKTQIGKEGSSAQLDAQITDLTTKLETTRKTYGVDHPDVISLTHQIDKLKTQRAALPENTNGDMIKHDADNPAYLQLVTQLMSAQEQHKALLAQRETLLSQQTQYAKNIAENPTTDQEMAKLARDYDNAQLRYRELKEKKMSADMIQQLEQGQKGQRMVVINPPSLPESTHPSRSLLMLGGLLLSLMGGLCSVTLVELVSPSVHNARHLASLVGAMPLVVIPYIYTDLEASHPLGRWQSASGIAEMLANIGEQLSGLIPRFRK